MNVAHRSQLYFGIQCEIQLKTMLHDSWAAKTHPLTYKPLGRLDNRVAKLMQSLGDTLEAVEQQSEFLKAMIEDEWNTDSERRSLGRRVLTEYLDRTYTPEMTKQIIPEAKQILDGIKDKLNNEGTAISRLHINDSGVSKLVGSLEKLGQYDGALGATCVVAVLLAVLRPNGDLNHVALQYLDRWMGTLQDAPALIDGLIFQSLAKYSFGDLSGAVNAASHALELCTEGQKNNQKSRIQANLAYYLAERSLFERGGDRDADKKAAETFIAEAEAAAPDRLPSLLNTKGFVKIAFGDSEDSIEEGLKICQAARDCATGDAKLATFYEWHRRLAWRRLLEVTERAQGAIPIKQK